MTTYNELTQEHWDALSKSHPENTIIVRFTDRLIKRKLNLRYQWYKLFQLQGYEFTPDEIDKVLNKLNTPLPLEQSDSLWASIWSDSDPLSELSDFNECLENELKRINREEDSNDPESRPDSFHAAIRKFKSTR